MNISPSAASTTVPWEATCSSCHRNDSSALDLFALIGGHHERRFWPRRVTSRGNHLDKAIGATAQKNGPEKQTDQTAPRTQLIIFYLEHLRTC
jgi:hypothetical protein